MAKKKALWPPMIQGPVPSMTSSAVPINNKLNTFLRRCTSRNPAMRRETDSNATKLDSIGN
jgi:hypothetical protein